VNIKETVLEQIRKGFDDVSEASSLPRALYEGLCEMYEGNRKNKHAAESSNSSSDREKSYMAAIIEEVSQDITRIFEYQIGAMRTLDDVSILSLYAVEKILESGTEANAKHHISNFSREGLISALLDQPNTPSVLEKIVNDKKVDTIFDMNNKTVRWDPHSVFTNVGLRVQLPDGSFQFQIKPITENRKSDNNTICGYRSPILQWDNKLKIYVDSPLDANYTELKNLDQKDGGNNDDGVRYLPFYRLVTQTDIDNYISQFQLRDKTSIESFQKYYQTRYEIAHRIIPVFRQIQFSPNTDLSGSDFTEGDFTRICIKSCIFQNSKFINTRLIMSELEGVDMEGSDMSEADFRWSYLSKVNMRRNTILITTNFDWSILDEGTDLTNNPYFTSARIFEANILTKKTQLRFPTDDEQNLKEKMDEILLKMKSERNIEVKDKFQFYFPPPTTPDFVGREGVMMNLEKIFKQNHNTSAVTVMSAPSGMGKTQTVLKFVERYTDELYGIGKEKRVCWISAEREDTLATGFFELAKSLNIDTENNSSTEIRDLVYGRFETIPTSLFIFDNVEDPDFLDFYFPKRPSPNQKHHFIITTKDSGSWKKAYNVIKLLPFSNEDAIQYIRNSRPLATEKDEDIIRLAREVEHIPESFVIAEAYMKRYDRSISELLDLIQRLGKISGNVKGVNEITPKDVDVDLGPKASKWGRISISNMYNTLSIIINNISQDNPKAIYMMNMCAYLNADNIPLQLFKNMFNNSDNDLATAVALLSSCNLISFSTNGDEILLFIHQNVQENLRIKLVSEGRQYKTITSVAEILREYFSSGKEKELIMKNNMKLFSHSLSLISNYKLLKSSDEVKLNEYDNTKLMEMMANIYHSCGVAYDIQEEYDKALEMYTESLQLKKEVYGDDNSSLTDTMSNMGRAFYNQEKYDKALEMYAELRQVLEAIYGYEDSSIADTINNMGNVYDSQGEYDKALEMYEESLRIKRAICGDDHSSVADIMSNMGNVYDSQEKYDKALEVYAESLRISRAIYGLDHPSIAKILDKMALAYGGQGENDKALEMYTESLRIRKVLYGNAHPSIAMTLDNLAMVYGTQGEYDKVLEMYTESLLISENVYGREHPSIALILLNIATVYSSQGEYDKALEIYKESLRISEIVYGRDHPSIANIMTKMGEAYFNQGKFYKALEMCTESLRISELLYGHEHSSVATTLDAMGNVYNNLHDSDKALEMYTESLRIKKATYHRDDPSIAYTLNNMGVTLYNQGKYDEALEIHAESLRILEAVFGHDHPAVAEILENMGNVYESQGKYDKAHEVYVDSCQIRKKS
jgi:tetratricopeptide (TPR) repeat protein